MHRAALLTCLLTVSMMNQVSGLETITGKYGDTIEIPCNKSHVEENNLSFVKWKYDKDGNILVKNLNQNVSISNDVNYKNRVSIKKDFSLVITQVTMADRRTFTCIVVGQSDLLEYPVQLAIYMRIVLLGSSVSENSLVGNFILGRAAFDSEAPPDVVERVTGRLKDRHVMIINSPQLLQTNISDHQITQTGFSELPSLLYTYPFSTDPTENVSLQAVPQGPYKEGDNVTLKCTADGNPPPTSYNFYINGEKKTVNSNMYTLTSVTRANTGEYKCSLVDNEDLDVVLSTTGKIVKKLGESFETTIDVKASGAAQTSWKKGNTKLNSLPKFDKLTYSDSGMYECIVSMTGLKETRTFQLVVEGSPVIKNLIKQRGEGMTKVLKCAAEGFPKPTVQWSVNGTNAAESVYEHGKVTYSITIIPKGNLTVSCMVSNVLGSDIKSINVSALVEDVTMDKQDQKDEYSDQTPLAVGIVVGLMVAVLAIGLAYWLYMKKYRIHLNVIPLSQEKE
ncbi:CD166 antigen -like protein [Labeo rohita]|uniref:CD166 antigen-like protein n=1 Tax=Labeo rohita TaxID=84645 RepID=A0A498LMH5_LABRO|nr:CD166 antigen -like protein [Labeo rohita]